MEALSLRRLLRILGGEREGDEDIPPCANDESE